MSYILPWDTKRDPFMEQLLKTFFYCIKALECDESGNLDCVHSLFIDEETKNKMLKESKRRRMRASQWLREREKWEDWRKLKERNCDFRVFIIKIKTLMAGNRDHGARFTRKWMTIAESISLDVHLPGKRSCFLVLWQFQIELLFFFSLCLSLL